MPSSNACAYGITGRSMPLLDRLVMRADRSAPVHHRQVSCNRSGYVSTAQQTTHAPGPMSLDGPTGNTHRSGQATIRGQALARPWRERQAGLEIEGGDCAPNIVNTRREHTAVRFHAVSVRRRESLCQGASHADARL